MFSNEFKDKVKNKLDKLRNRTLPEKLMTLISKIYLKKNKFKTITMYYRFGSNDKSVIDDIITNDEYLNYNLGIKKNSIIFDIGCHIGSFSLQAGKIACEGKVFAFEPVKENYELAKKNIEVNNLKNIMLTNMGVLSETKKVKFYVSNENTGCHGIIKRSQKESKVIKIDCIGFDEFISQNNIKKIDVLKLDCEGAEYDILLNSNLKIVERIILEYHEFPNITEDLDLLESKLRTKGFVLEKEVRYSKKNPVGVGVASFKKL